MDLTNILQLIVSATLVVITAWYAILTHSLAKSSKISAEYSQKAAEASQAAVVVAESGAKIEFSITPFGYRPENYPFKKFGGIYLQNYGATVWIHGAELIDPHSIDLPDIPEFRKKTPEPLIQTGRVPKRLHHDESLSFVRDLQKNSPLNGMLCAKVLYSFNGDGPVADRIITWSGEEI